MMKNLIRILTVVLFLTLAPQVSMGQSADQLYNTGLSQMKKKDYNGAIKSFKASMAINKSAANKKKCNARIKECNKYLGGGGGDDSKPTPTPGKTLDVGTSTMTFPAVPTATKAAQVTTTPETGMWTAKTKGNEKWCELSKSIDGTQLQITCQPAEKTILRQTDVIIQYGGLTRKIHVKQDGKSVELTPSSRFANFKLKGGGQQINIYCNSDTLYSDKTNWIIKESPSWCTVERNESGILVRAGKLEKQDPYYKTGRTGDIIIRSQGEECIIRVDQKKSLF